MSVPNFKSEWSAIAEATDLAFELGIACHVPGVLEIPVVSKPKKSVGKASVSFDERIELRIGLDDQLTMHGFRFSEAEFRTSSKPWRLYSKAKPRKDCQDQIRNPLPRPNSNFAFCSRDDPMIQLDEQCFLHVAKKLPLKCSRHALCLPHDSHQVWYSMPQTPKAMPSPFADSVSLSVNFNEKCFTLDTSHSAAIGDPPFLREAVSIPDQQCFDGISSQMSFFMPTLCEDHVFQFDFPSCEDESRSSISFIEWFFGVSCPSGDASSSSHTPESRDTGSHHTPSSLPTAPPLPEVPTFARAILETSVQGVPASDLPGIRGLWIRVWYIHLQIHVRSFLARHCQLQGPPHTWRAQVIALWQEVLVQNEEYDITLVSPTPPRNSFETELAYDLILFQGADGRRLPGVVTMRPNDPGVGRALYSGAVALPPAVNSEAVLESLALTRLCQERVCQIRQGRTVLASGQYYQMSNGLSYLVEVGHFRSVAAGAVPVSSSSQTRPSRFRATNVRPDHSSELERLTQLRNSGQLSSSTVNVEELDAPTDLQFERPVTHPSLQIVSSSCPEDSGVPSPRCVSVVGPVLSSGPHLSSFKLTDNSDQPGQPPQDTTPAQLVPVPIPLGPPAPLILPAFVHDMFRDLPEMFLHDDLIERGFSIRTWYIHHDTLRRTRVYRLLRLQGPPHTWQAQIIALWIDRILPLEALEIDLVKPTPSRDTSERLLAFDVILSQGLHPDCLAGLIQVDPPLHDRLIPRFAMAATFPTRVSGRILIATLAFQQVCQDYRCLLYHRWTVIPLSHARVHNMNPGDSFLVSVQAGRLANAESPPAQPPDRPKDSSSSSSDVDMLDPSTSSGSGTGDLSGAAPAPAPENAPASSSQSSDLLDVSSLTSSNQRVSPGLQRVHLYRLNQPVSVGLVRWLDPNGLLHDVAATLGVSPVDVVAMHLVLGTPVGQPSQEPSLIVQMTHDIALAADDQLVLVDVDLHQSGAGMSLAPHLTDRRVHKVQYPLARVHLLQYAHVAHYCEHMRNRCIVRVNHSIWPFQDIALRTLQHGTYIQIVLPPPTAGLPTVRTVQVVEDFPDVDADAGFATVYPHWFRSPAPAPDVTSVSPAPKTSSSAAEHCKTLDTKGSRFVGVPCPDLAVVEHVGDDDQISAPTFSRSADVMVPIGPGNQGLPQIHDMDPFRLSMGVTFRDYAEVEFEEQGPILNVATWFVNHDIFPRCMRHVIVQLEGDPATWPDTLCSPWRHLFQPGQPIAFRHVMPSPPRLFHDRHRVHVIIEQALHQPSHTALFSIEVQGVHHDSRTQLASSVPQQLSAESALSALDLESRCRVYRCTVWSGVLQFTPRDEEAIFSGIGIFVHIHGPRFRHLLLDFGDQPFWHVSSSSAAGSSQNVSLQRRLPSELPVSCDRSLQTIQDAAHHLPHADTMFNPHLRVAWQQYLARTTQPPFRFQVVTWFCDHIRLPRSADHRVAVLPIDPQGWYTELLQVWHDWILPGLGISMYVVNPPPRGAVDFVAHVILAQNEQPDHATVLISSTVPDENQWDPVHRVVKLPQTVDHHMLIHEGGLANMCPPVAYGLLCQSWHGAQELTDGRLYLASSGDGFFIAASDHAHVSIAIYEDPSLIIHRLFARVAEVMTHLVSLVAHASDLNSSPDVSSALTLHLDTPDSLRTCERLRDSAVAQACRPQDSACTRTTISLDSALHPLVPLHLIDGAECPSLPDHLLLPDPVDAHTAEAELSLMFLYRHVYILGSTGFAFCLPIDWSAGSEHHIYLCHPLIGQSRDDIMVHRSPTALSDVALMQLLYSFGFFRAVILTQSHVREGLTLVEYHNNEPLLEQPSSLTREPTPWPVPMPCYHARPFFDPDRFSCEVPDHTLTYDVDFGFLTSLFESGHDVLCCWHSHLELPDLVRARLPVPDPLEGQRHDLSSFDRFVIYTDGSSKASNRRRPPLWVQEHDVPDSWAYVVLGERYSANGGESTTVLLGWHAQTVTYEVDLSHFIGTDQIGSEFSEREALFLSALWRLSINLDTPTVFRSDSVTSATQSTGLAGSCDTHPTYKHLRCIMQALQAALPEGCFAVEHVRGHAGDVWNEFADYLAKTEAATGHRLTHQKVHMPQFCQFLPYLWMLFDRTAGLPVATRTGFDVRPPQLPPVTCPEPSSSPVRRQNYSVQFSLSLATLNVGSLFTGPDGYGGKLQYLRDQFQAHGFNVLGLQETRSPAGMSTVDDVLRLSSGSDKGHHGVELWFSLKQPFGHCGNNAVCLRKNHVQVLHADPRRLLARLAHPSFHCFFLVLHGPQSGRALHERRDWWRDTQELVSRFCSEHPLYVLMDANAKTGPLCEPIVFSHADASSANTDFMIQFLRDNALCLPCTCDIHTGLHHTWTAVDGLSFHRIDYVAIPQEELTRCVYSAVLDSLEPGNCIEDHRAVGLQLQWSTSHHSPDRSQPSQMTFNRHSIRVNCDCLQLQTLQAAEWTADIESQVRAFNHDILHSLQTACPQSRASRKKPFLSDFVWSLRQTKLQLHRRLRHARWNQRQDLLRLAFWAWSHRQSGSSSEPFDVVLDSHAAHTVSVTCSFVSLTCRYIVTARRLKRELQQCKQFHLQSELATTTDKTSAGELLHLLKPFLGSSNPKKQKKAGLPSVRKGDGSICTTPDEATARWTEFFGRMEGGTPLSSQAYRRIWLDNLARFRDTGPFELSLSEVPSLVELEAAFRRVAVGKAVGEDAIPPEICRYKAVDLARITYPMLLKAFLFGQEAMEHKGGRLAAFYRIVRPFALGGCLSDEDIATIASRLGFAEDTLHQFHDQLAQPSAIQQAGASPFVQRFLQALHSDTWFRIGTDGPLVRTTIGSRPGDSYADVVFGLLWAKLLHRYEQLLVEHDVLEMIPVQDFPDLFSSLDSSATDVVRVPYLGPTWMDDLNVCLAADSNLALERKTSFALSLLLDLCQDLHMQPSLCKGKTEVMFTFRGAEARSYRRKYFSDACPLKVIGEHQVYAVSVVSRYLHLGSLLHHRDVDRVEVTRRLAIAHQAFTTHRRLLYHNPRIAWDKRREIFGSLILSKLVYGLESWTLSSQKVKDQFYSGVMRLYRRLLKLPHDSHSTDLELLTAVGLPLPDELLCGCRLRYFGTLHNCGAAAHWGLLREDTAWTELLKADFQWIWAQLHNTVALGDPSQHYAAWKDVLVFHGGYWKKLIKRAIAHAIGQRSNHQLALAFHRQTGEILLQYGWVADLPLQVQTCDPSETFGCMMCGTRHLSHAGECVHMFKCHQRVAPARCLFDETHCPACLREFHARSKVLAHLRHAHHCRQTLLGRRLQCPVMPGVGSAVDRGLGDRHDGALPFQQAAGPVQLPARLRDFDQHWIPLFEGLYLCLLDLQDSESLFVTLQQEIRQHAVCWTMCRKTLCRFLEEFSIEDAEPLIVPFETVVCCVQRLADSRTWPFLQAPCQRASHDLHGELPLWEQWYDALAFEPPASWTWLPPQPRSLTRQRVILHAYAGRRRRGDIEWYIDEISIKYPGVVLQVVSIDIIIDEVYGDITRASTRRFWLRHILQGHVVGFLAGPPCNTWSRARAHQLSQARGPRVVRTPATPWGIPSLSLRELSQVGIGTLLLGFAIQCLVALSMHSGAGFLEHPKEPDEPEHVSIWKLPIIRFLLNLPGFRLVHLSQGLWGAASAKPTTLLVLGMSNLEKHLHACRVTKHLPQGASVGRSEDGGFKTAPLKEYPPSMCKGIAQALCEDLVCMECDQSELPTEFTAQCKAMLNPFFGEFIGRD
eukprot:s104_g7.t1